MIEDINQQILDLLEKNNLKMQLDINFPLFKDNPLEVQLALSILKKYGMTIVMKVVPKV